MKSRQLRWDVVCTLLYVIHITCASDLNAAEADAAKSSVPSSNAISALPLPPAARRVIERPTLIAAGPRESFRGSPALYQWLLEHPDQAMKAWLRLGARGREISDCGAGRFAWSDGAGTAVIWETVHRDPEKRIWYAEGVSQPTRLLPAVPIRAVVVMHYEIDRDGEPPLLRHHAELFLQTDSRTAQLITRMLGPSAPRLAEQGLVQLELFFSALIVYLDRYPEHVAALRGGQ